jgi:hypothetical protein
MVPTEGMLAALQPVGTSEVRWADPLVTQFVEGLMLAELLMAPGWIPRAFFYAAGRIWTVRQRNTRAR